MAYTIPLHGGRQAIRVGGPGPTRIGHRQRGLHSRNLGQPSLERSSSTGATSCNGSERIRCRGRTAGPIGRRDLGRIDAPTPKLSAPVGMNASSHGRASRPPSGHRAASCGRSRQTPDLQITLQTAYARGAGVLAPARSTSRSSPYDETEPEPDKSASFTADDPLTAATRLVATSPSPAPPRGSRL